MQKKNTLDPQNAEQIGAIAKKYDEAVDNNDASALAALFTDDAVVVTDAPRSDISGVQS